MPKDAEFRRCQREAYEAVLKALSVVKLDWSKQKLLAELRKHLNISQSTYVELLDKVLRDPEVRASKGMGSGTLADVLDAQGGTTRAPRRKPQHETENETDTEGDEDYRKDDDVEEEDSYSEGSTSRPNRTDVHRRLVRGAGRGKKRPAPTGRRRGKQKGRAMSQDSVGSGSRNDTNPLTRDEVLQYEMSHVAAAPGDVLQMKPPYDKDVFERCLVSGSLEILREMHRQVKRRRQTLIDVLLDEDDNSVYPDDDLVQKILLREKNVRQERALEHELSSLDKGV